MIKFIYRKNLRVVDSKKNITKENENMKEPKRENRGITLIALIVTTIFSYDENVKSSNNKGFLLQSI